MYTVHSVESTDKSDRHIQYVSPNVFWNYANGRVHNKGMFVYSAFRGEQASPLPHIGAHERGIKAKCLLDNATTRYHVEEVAVK